MYRVSLVGITTPYWLEPSIPLSLQFALCSNETKSNFVADGNETAVGSYRYRYGPTKLL